MNPPLSHIMQHIQTFIDYFQSWRAFVGSRGASVYDGHTNPQDCRGVVVVVVGVGVGGPLKLTIIGHHVRPVKIFTHLKTHLQVQI